ncbi:MAG TPA: outer membrane beta-barrel protein [Candidatus Angelobacter sp.]|nr:outer membrane beta-barrel protein [Candidatus Angelobacter sp.]
MQKVISPYMAAAALLIFLLAASRSFAQNDSDVRVTAFGSGSFLKGDRSFTVDGDPKRSNFATGGKFGVRVTGNLNSRFAVEGAYSYGTNNLRIIDVGPPAVTRPFGTRLHQITGNGLYYFSDEPKKGLKPFVTAGLGLARFNPTSKAKSAATVEFVNAPATINGNTKLEFNFGGGAEATITDHWGARVDLRDHIAGIPHFGIPQAPAAGIADFFPVNGVVNDVELSGGVVFHFGH